jgi:hypothetical protein
MSHKLSALLRGETCSWCKRSPFLLALACSLSLCCCCCFQRKSFLCSYNCLVAGSLYQEFYVRQRPLLDIEALYEEASAAGVAPERYAAWLVTQV